MKIARRENQRTTEKSKIFIHTHINSKLVKKFLSQHHIFSDNLLKVESCYEIETFDLQD